MSDAPAQQLRRGAADPAELRARVIAAARRCFLRYGVQRTSMADVAEAAGISRAALYRLIPSASDLLEAVVIERVGEIADGLRPALAKTRIFGEAIVELTLVAVRGARADEELQNFFATSTSLRIHHLLTGDFPAVSRITVELFRPMFTAARASGELRTDADDELLAEWLRGVMLMLILREDLDAAGEEAILRTFLLPSLGLPAARSAAVPDPHTGGSP